MKAFEVKEEEWALEAFETLIFSISQANRLP